MQTPAQVAKRANVHVHTIRNWTKDYAVLLSPQGRGETGRRLFTDEDVEVLCAVAVLRNSGLPPAEVIARLRDGQPPPVIDVAIEPSPQEGQQALQEPVEALSTTQMAYGALQSRLEAVERRLDNRVNEFVTGIVLGVAIVLVVVAIVLGMV